MQTTSVQTPKKKDLEKLGIYTDAKNANIKKKISKHYQIK